MLLSHRLLFIFLLFFFIFGPIWAAETTDPTADPTLVSYMNDELKDLQKDVDKEFNTGIPETPKDLLAIKNAAVVLVGEGENFEKNKINKIFWKKIYKFDNNNNRQENYLLLAVDPNSKTASFGEFMAGNEDLIKQDNVSPGFLKIDRENASCIDCNGRSMDQAYIEMAANKLLEMKSFDLEMKEAVQIKINQLRVRFEKGRPTQKRLFIYHGVFMGKDVTEARDEELNVIQQIQNLAEKNNIQLIKDPNSYTYFYTLVDENKFEDLVGGTSDDLWGECEKFFGLK